MKANMPNKWYIQYTKCQINDMLVYQMPPNKWYIQYTRCQINDILVYQMPANKCYIAPSIIPFYVTAQSTLKGHHDFFFNFEPCPTGAPADPLTHSQGELCR
uniref:Uncharacterized protein n=1 Tax=Anguilla anguilla TaxID=7936 RepID=A0A0E9WIS6_ANGAN